MWRGECSFIEKAANAQAAGAAVVIVVTDETGTSPKKQNTRFWRLTYFSLFASPRVCALLFLLPIHEERAC